MKVPINYPDWVERAALLIEQAYVNSAKEYEDEDIVALFPESDEIKRIILSARLGIT